jgi:thiol:disulfide interchange protein DsbD
MARFKEFLAFPMFATAIWLAWVMGNQAGTDGLLKLLIAALLIGFALWLLRRGSFGKLLGAAALLAAITIPLTLGAQAKAGPEKNAQAWSPAAVQEALAEGRPVFVDFTADWCVTCKVNERLVINTDKTRALFERTDTAFLIADWTNKNDMIAQELAKYDRAGVPLYLVYHPDQNSVRAEVLPQILTYDVLETALEGTKERS